MINNYILIYSAFPIHPPEGGNDPWNVEFPPDCGYKIRCEKGVYKVYKNEEDMNNNKPLNYEVNTVMLTDLLPYYAIQYSSPSA